MFIEQWFDSNSNTRLKVTIRLRLELGGIRTELELKICPIFQKMKCLV